MEPLTAGAIATLAFTKAFEKTIEKFTEAALVKMDKLRKKIWDKLRGNIKAETALTAAEKGSKADLDTVTAYLRVEMDKDEQFAQEVQTLAQGIPKSPTREFIESVQDSIPHLAEVAQTLIDAVGDKDLIGVFVGLGRFYQGQGLYALAEPWCKQCLSVVQERLGEEDSDVATSLNNLADICKSQGRYSEAEPLFVQALALRKRLLGEEHPDVATSLHNLADIYKSQGRYAEAEPLYEEALEILQQVFEINHPKTVTVRENLENLRAKMNASHENLTNFQDEKSANNSWFERFLGFWRGN